MKIHLLLFFIFIGFNKFVAGFSLEHYQKEKDAGKLDQLLANNPARYASIVVTLDKEVPPNLPHILDKIPGFNTLIVKGPSIYKISNWSILNTSKKMETLVFSVHCGLHTSPPGLSALDENRTISFKNNPIRYLGEEMLEFLKRRKSSKRLAMDLTDTYLRYEDSGEGLGAFQLLPFERMLRLPRRFTMFGSDNIYTKAMADEINEFLRETHDAPLIANARKLRELKAKKFDRVVLSWDNFWAQLQMLLNSFELDNEKAKNYLSFEFFRESIEELNPAIRHSIASNGHLIRQELFPRFRGFAKALYGDKPDERLGEKAGAQPHPWDRGEVQLALGHAIKGLNLIKDPSEKSAKFSQLKGLLHCVEGYIEAINTMIYGDEEWKNSDCDWETKVRRMLAAEKLGVFKESVVEHNFAQSAHQAAFYGHYLKHILALSNVADIYQGASMEQAFYDLKTTGHITQVVASEDPENYYRLTSADVRMAEMHPQTGKSTIFFDDNGNSIEAVLHKFFYERFTPNFMARQIMEHFETKRDFKRTLKFAALSQTKVLSKMNFLKNKIKDIDANVKLEEEKFYKDISELRKRIEEDKKREKFLYDEEFQEICAGGDFQRNSYSEDPLVENNREEFERWLSFTLKTEGEVDSLQIAWQARQNELQQRKQELKQALSQGLSEAEQLEIEKITLLGEKINRYSALHPLKFGDLFNYLKSTGRIYYDAYRDAYVNFERYFDTNSVVLDSSGDPIYATVHLLGAKRVLIEMGYIQFNPHARDGANRTLLDNLAHRLSGIYGSREEHKVLKQELLSIPISERKQWLHTKQEEESKKASSSQKGSAVKADIEAAQELLGRVLEAALEAPEDDGIIALIPDETALKNLLQLKFLSAEKYRTSMLSDTELLMIALRNVISSFESENDLVNKFEEDCREELLAKCLEKNTFVDDIPALSSAQNSAPHRLLFFGDIIALLQHNKLIGEYDHDARSYPGIEKYFDLHAQMQDEHGQWIPTKLFDRDGKLIYADFRSQDFDFQLDEELAKETITGRTEWLGCKHMLEDTQLIIDRFDDLEGVVEQISMQIRNRRI